MRILILHMDSFAVIENYQQLQGLLLHLTLTTGTDFTNGTIFIASTSISSDGTYDI